MPRFCKLSQMQWGRRAQRCVAIGWGFSVVATLATGGDAAAGTSSDELVRQARAHEAAHEDDLAARRFNEALRLDPTSADAYLGLGALRLRLRDAREAERVFAVALEHLPGLHAALAGLARARWALGLHDAAAQELELYTAAEPTDIGALRELAGWYGEQGLTPAALTAWRRVVVIAATRADAVQAREARTMVRALQLLVGPADPATSPIAPNAARRVIAAAALRGG